MASGHAATEAISITDIITLETLRVLLGTKRELNISALPLWSRCGAAFRNTQSMEAGLIRGRVYIWDGLSFRPSLVLSDRLQALLKSCYFLDPLRGWTLCWGPWYGGGELEIDDAEKIFRASLLQMLLLSGSFVVCFYHEAWTDEIARKYLLPWKLM